jgi:hypothetical protein
LQAMLCDHIGEDTYMRDTSQLLLVHEMEWKNQWSGPPTAWSSSVSLIEITREEFPNYRMNCRTSRVCTFQRPQFAQITRQLSLSLSQSPLLFVGNIHFLPTIKVSFSHHHTQTIL